MGRPQVRLQTESKTERRFITIRDKRNGKTSYHKVYLRTKDEEVARRRLIALDGVDDVEEVRRRIDYLASAVSPDQEKLRLADFLHHATYIPVMTIEDAREELDNMFGGFVDEEPPSDELLDRWRRADGIEEWQPILIELGADSQYLLDPHCYSGLHPRGQKVDPVWWKKNPDEHDEVLAAQWKMPLEKWMEGREKAQGPKLLDCLPHFETEKRSKGTTARHRRTFANKFKRFVEFIGIKRISELTKKDFISWEDHVSEARGKRSNKWINDQLAPVAAIMKIAYRRIPDGVFPEGWRSWIEFRKAAYKPGLHNKMPMPVKVFDACIEQAKKWASLDIEACAEAMPLRGANAVMARANNFRQATRKKRAGHMIEAVLTAR